MTLTDNIIELNRDVEPLIIQGSATRTEFFKPKFDDRFKPLRFVHCADMHDRLDLWSRMVEYTNYYRDYLDFVIHTGDYCGGRQEQYTDLYNDGTHCELPIYPCVGNHDVYTYVGDDADAAANLKISTKQNTYKLIFAPFDLSGLNFMDGEFSMTYYRDFPDSNIRLIALDQYYDTDIQCPWFKGLLDDARAKDMCVITAMHEPSANINDTFGVTFHTINDYVGLNGKLVTHPFEPIIADFIADGGRFVCNLVGHEHHDMFGLTDAGVLNVVVPSGTCWDGWCDSKRIKGTRTFDCFNVMCVDVNLGLLKIVRVGNNRDHYLRSQRSLCYDYINRKVIFND